ncbi:hypothetical protein CXK97_00935 [Stutzerimonas stutzeri]|nr:hypothetical protein CXK97_00935 [Stutzerimonas stutzeri]
MLGRLVATQGIADVALPGERHLFIPNDVISSCARVCCLVSRAMYTAAAWLRAALVHQGCNEADIA